MVSFASLAFYLFVLLADCVLVFCNVYFLALFSDLESDQTNPIDMCKHLNAFILPEIIGHGILVVLFLLTGAWVPFFLNLPLLFWHLYRIKEKNHLLDATQIFRVLSKETKILFVKLGFYMLCFCVYLFYLIKTTLSK